MIPPSEQLRLLNLAYRKMQEDFQVFAEELFRTNATISTDANGYLLLPDNLTELEELITASNTDERWEKIDKTLQFHDTGYFWDGIDPVTGQRRIMVRRRGQAVASTSFILEFLKEYADLTATDDPIPPFVGNRYLDLITTLQAYYYFIEQGDDRAGEATRHFNIYKALLADVRRTYFDDNPTYQRSHSNDVGDERRYPLLNPSQS
jgi:hypothetical protein